MNDKHAQYIQDRLTKVLAPTQLLVVNESHKHIGHVGSKETGDTHYAVTIASPLFTDKTLVECHRLVYEALGSKVGSEIHSVTIKINRENK